MKSNGAKGSRAKSSGSKENGMKSSEAKTNGTKSNGATTPAFEALLYQLLETELGGVEVYRAALGCVINAELEAEWEKYLSETERHVEIAVSRGFLEKRDVPAVKHVETPADEYFFGHAGPPENAY